MTQASPTRLHFQSILLTAFIISIVINCSNTKAQKFTFTHTKFVSQKSAYITKFIFGPGEHKFRLKQKIGYGTLASESRKFGLKLVLVNRHDWQKGIHGCDLLDKSLRTYKVSINQNGDEMTFSKLTTPKFHERTFLLFYLVDCDGRTSKMPNSRNRIIGTIYMKNLQSHFADNEKNYIHFLLIFGILFSILAIYMFRDFLLKCRKSEQLNRVYLMVNISLILKALSFPFEILHLWVFSYNGYGLEFQNFVGQTFNYLSQYILTVTLIFVAYGWTINVDSIEDFDQFLPVSIMLGIFQIIIIGLGRLADNEENFMHRYDNFVGWILVGFNVGMYVYFVAGIIQTKAELQNKKMDRFLNTLAVFGSVYFFAFPALMVISVFFIPYDMRAPVVEIGRIVSQCIGILTMSFVVTNKKGIYAEVSNWGLQLPSTKGDQVRLDFLDQNSLGESGISISKKFSFKISF